MSTLSRLSDIFESATAQNAFYKKFYGIRSPDSGRSISTWNEWRTLPTISKNDLLTVPLAERSSLPLRYVEYLSSSSGTTGTLPLFSPRAHFLEYDFRTAFYEPRGAALSSTPVPHQQEYFLAARDLAPRVVVIDPRNPAATARLARAAGVDSIFAFLFHIPLIAEHLKREGVCESIRFIETTGEACPQSMYHAMAKMFPHAVITSVYGTSEVENSPMGIPCRPMSATEPFQTFHPKDGLFFELAQEDGTTCDPSAGSEGELVLTAYRDELAAFPFIRYRTGDKVRFSDRPCSEHEALSFTVLGRAETDFVKVTGGILKADEIERVLRLFNNRVTDVFELHVYETADPSDTRPKVVLEIETLGSADLNQLATDIASHLRVSPTSTYAEGVASGTYKNLECRILPKSDEKIGKRKRVIRHTI